MFASQYVRSRTGRLLLERLAEEENRQKEIDETSVSADLTFECVLLFYEIVPSLTH